MKMKEIVIASIMTVVFLVPAHWGQALICGRVVAAEPGSPVLVEFDFDPGEPQLTIPFQLGKERYRFGFATRDSTSFRKSFADTLPRLPPEVDAPDHPIVALRQAPIVRLGPMTIRFPKSFVECGLSDIENKCFSQCDAIAGLDVLAQHIVQIDFDERKIRFLRTVPEKPGDRFEIASLQRRPRLCAVTVKAQCGSGPAEEFSVELERPDAIYVSSSTCLRLLEKGEFWRPHDESTFDSSPLATRVVGTASSFTLGRFETKDVRTVIYRDNIIGLGYLSRYVVTFDFPRGAMYLRPGKQFDRQDAYDASGLFATMRDNALEVIFCDIGSAAHEAGLQEHDAIVALDGQPVSRMNQSSFRKTILQRGRTVHVHFKRDGVDHNVEMKLPAFSPRKAGGKLHPIDYDRAREYILPFPSRGSPFDLPEAEPDEPKDARRQRLRYDLEDSFAEHIADPYEMVVIL